MSITSRVNVILLEHLSNNISINKINHFRYTSEKMKNAGRSSIFNLGDADTLTHKGHKIDEIDQFEKPGSDDEVRNSCYSTIQIYECSRN